MIRCLGRLSLWLGVWGCAFSEFRGLAVVGCRLHFEGLGLKGCRVPGSGLKVHTASGLGVRGFERRSLAGGELPVEKAL